MSASEKRSLRERLRPKERKPAVRWLLTVLLLAAAVLGLHMLLQMIGTLDFSRGRFSSYLHVPKIYLLNLLPVALLVAFTYFATNRAWLGFLIPSVLLGARPHAEEALVAPRSGAGAHRAAGLRCMGALVRQYRSL